MNLPLLNQFFRCSFSDKMLLLEALIWTALCKAIIQWIPLRVYAPFFLGQPKSEILSFKKQCPPDQIAPISWAVQVVSRFMPWRNKCFAMAMAAKTMLRARGIGSTLYLGVKKDVTTGIRAHAWLRHCNVPVIGGDDKTFAPISAFSKL